MPWDGKFWTHSNTFKAQVIVKKITDEMTRLGYPPELTHKQHLLDCSMYDEKTPVSEIVARVLVGAYHSKAALIQVAQYCLETRLNSGGINGDGPDFDFSRRPWEH